MKNIINLTPHSITIEGVAEIRPSGQVARVQVRRKPVGWINNIPVFTPIMGKVEGLPNVTSNTLYIVSAMVRTHPDVANRWDVFSPGQLVRDQDGNVVGCDGLDANNPMRNKS